MKFLCIQCKQVIETQFLKPGEQAKCKNCGALVRVPDVGDDALSVLKAGPPLADNPISPSERIAENKIAEARYPALRTIAFVYELLAILVGLIAIGFLIYGFSLIGQPYNTSKGTGLIFVLGSLFCGGLLALTLRAAAEIIRIFVQIEVNTRSNN